MSEQAQAQTSNLRGPLSPTEPPPLAAHEPTVGGTKQRVEDLRELLGHDVVLLPIRRGEKVPVAKCWQKLTVADMEDPEYLRRLSEGNIGVLLGKPSGGLCTIDLDLDEEVEPFLALNPKLHNTLRTRRVRGCNLWVRVTGDYPASGKITTADGLEWGEWRADGCQTVIHGEAIDRGKGEKQLTAYKILHRANPVEIRFEDIQWPAQLVLPWNGYAVVNDHDKLITQFGPPYYTSDEGRFSALNEPYWAGLYADENVLLYEPEERSFYSYDAKTGLYRPESESALKCKISTRMLEASRQTQVLAIQKKRTAGTLSNIVSHLRGFVEKRGAFADRQPVIHLANGVIVFREGDADFLEFSPAFYSRNASPIDFDEKAKCERFLNELVLPAVHPDDVELLQKVAGMFLLGYNRAQRMLILDGEGDRGKTQLANVFQGIVGHANCTQLRTKFLGERFELFRFLKKMLLVGVDVDPDFLSTKGAGVLKGLVGGDWFDAEQKGGTGSFPMQGVFNVCVTSNARLKVRLCGDVGAWRRRLLIIRFEAPPPKLKIHDFGALLVRIEGSGILNWMIDGAAMVLQDMPNDGGDISLTERQRNTVDSLLAESDSLRHFLADCVRTDPGADLTVRELVEAYAAYCPTKGWKALPVTEVYGGLEGLMLELFTVGKAHSLKRDGSSQRGFRGVRLQS